MIVNTERWFVKMNFRFFKYLKDSKPAQYAMVIVPFIIFSLYLTLFGLDMYGIVEAVVVNNNRVQQGLDDGSVLEIRGTTVNTDDSFTVTLHNPDSVTIERTESLVCEVYKAQDGFTLRGTDASELEIKSIDFIECVGLGNGIYSYNIFGEGVTCADGDPLFDVIYEDSVYSLKFVDSGKSVKVSKYDLSFVNVTDNDLIILNSDYKVQVNSLTPYTVTVLPSNSLYFDISSNTVLQNVGDNFGLKMLFDSTHWIVILSSLVFMLAIPYLGSKFDIVLFKRVQVKIMFGLIFVLSLLIIGFLILMIS